MTNTQLPGLVVDLEARIDRFEKAFAKANRTQRRTSNEMERRAQRSSRNMARSYNRAGRSITASFANLARVGGPIALVTAAAAGATAAVDRVIGSIANLGTEAERAGLSTEAFQAWGFVAEQNRISIDALTDGFKELQLRADEFVATGRGSAAEAFTRLGFQADDLRARLDDPSELMLDIVGRLQRFDRAAQIRIADEIFGGTGGEQFVQMLDQGEEGLRATIARANELGLVLDQAVIDRAAEVDRRFNEIRSTTRAWLREFVVDAVDAAETFQEAFRAADPIFGDASSSAMLETVADGLTDRANALANAFNQSSTSMRAWGYDEQAASIANASNRLRDLTEAYRNGEITADQFAQQLSEVSSEATNAMASLDEVDRVEFSNVIGQLAGLAQAVAGVLGLAVAANAELDAMSDTPSGPSPMTTFRNADAESMRNLEAFEAAQQRFNDEEQRRNALTAEGVQLEREIVAARERAAAAGATLSNQQARSVAMAAIAAENARAATPETEETERGGGGGSDRYNQLRGRLQDEIRQMDLERAAFVAAAAAGGEFADVLDQARIRAQLLNEALRSGRADSPALRAEIDQLADGYTRAAGEMAEAEDRIQGIEDARQRLSQTGESAFVGLVTGALSLREALNQVLNQLLQMAASRVFQQVIGGAFGAKGGGLFGSIFSWLGFDQGGYTGDGPRLEPAGIVHRGEYVMSKPAVQNIGLGNLEAMHQGALRGYSGGGLVGGAQRFATPPTSASAGRSAPPTVSINAPVTVNGGGGTPEQNQDLARRVSREMEQSMRTVVVEELIKQKRPGNLLNPA